MGGTMHPDTSSQAPAASSQKPCADGHLYRPHGKFAPTYGLPIVSKGDGLLLQGGCAAECTASLKKGTLDGQDITYIQNDYPRDSEAFHRELYLYSHEKLLRPLQGMSVPLVIGAYTPPEGGPFIAMEPLHGCAWSGADSTACEQVKRNVLHAYTQLHSRGILHGSVKSQHVIYSVKCDVYLVNFSEAATLDDHTAGGVRRCTQEDLDEEARNVESLLNTPPSNETPTYYFKIPDDMKTPQWADSNNVRTSSPAPTHGVLAQPTPRLHSSPSSQSRSPPVSRHTSPLTVSTPAVGVQRPRFDRLSVSDQSPLQNLSSPPRRVSSPKPKRVAFHPDTEDNWMWGQSLRTPQLSAREQAALQAERWQDDDEDTLVPSDAPDSPHLTYQEPPPRPVEDIPNIDEATNFETLIIITSPTGNNCVYGVSAEMAAKIQKDLMFSKAKPLPPGNPLVASQKRKAGSSDTEHPPRKRASPPRDESSSDSGPDVHAATPRAGPSRPGKRKAEDDLREQEIPSSNRSSAVLVGRS